MSFALGVSQQKDSSHMELIRAIGAWLMYMIVGPALIVVNKQVSLSVNVDCPNKWLCILCYHTNV